MYWKSSSECLPQVYLRGGGTLDEMAQKWGITAKRHGRYPDLVQLKYSMIDSPFAEPIVRQCRGIILDEKQNWRVIASPFHKFFNHGEALAASIDWADCHVQEKLDGSMMMLYHYNDEWLVASSGMPDAAGDAVPASLGMASISFAQLFWMAFNEKGFTLPYSSQKAFTFMFELMTPYNRIVVKYPKPDLKLIGVRNIWTGCELPPHIYSNYDPVRRFPLKSIDDVLSTFNVMNPLEQEGYVIVDRNYNRVKVKHPGYIALHHLRGNGSLNSRRVVELVRMGEKDEVLSAFPEWSDVFNKASECYDELVSQVTDDYQHLRGITSQKEFAIEAVKTRCAGCLFALRNSKVNTVREYMEKLHIDQLVSMLGV